MLHFPGLETFQHETLMIGIRRKRRLHFKTQCEKPGKRWGFGDKNKRADNNCAVSVVFFHIISAKKQENHQEEQNKASGKERDFVTDIVIPMSHYNTKCYIIFLTDRNRAWLKMDSSCSQTDVRIICHATLLFEIICFSHFEWKFPTIIWNIRLVRKKGGNPKETELVYHVQHESC